jgi:hypothetical protein
VCVVAGIFANHIAESAEEFFEIGALGWETLVDFAANLLGGGRDQDRTLGQSFIVSGQKIDRLAGNAPEFVWGDG